MLRRCRVSRAPLPAFVPTIWVAGLNYTSHAQEVGLPIPERPIFTMKSTSSLLYPPGLKFSLLAQGAAAGEEHQQSVFCGTFGNTIVVPKTLQSPPEVDYEGELAVVIGARCSRMTREDVVRDYDKVIAGYTCSMDITARRWQGKKGAGQWVVSKSFDTFTPLGPEVVKVPLDELPSLALTTRLNGKVVQQDRFSSFIFDVPTLVSFLSHVCVLHPGTVLLTGTPAGVGFARKAKMRSLGSGGDGQEKMVPDPYYLVHGDALEVSIDKIGSLQCKVELEGQTGARLPF